ncbi:SIS domain-containing protein [Gulosibacter chungangensis]|uniref:SIS domain-containing protein n=1 Tax=Gulosibacter chungangensis TaxID=979746 RepID=UPI001CE42A9E|nr:SIS domain-containing protein [Gulosibacter chungangensis]
MLRPGDVCLAVSDSGTNQFTMRSVRNALQAGATVIGLTSYGRSELVNTADYALIAGAEFHTWKEYGITADIVQMLLLSALNTAALAVDPATELVREDALEEVRAAIFPQGE